tara:strand:+ start:2139 stop:3206 length:1068 start_codon:yes stop_codon:yes gene_type:complete
MSKFSAFFDNNSRAGTLADFAHADALYVRNNLRLSPKTKFLYHVVFDVNQEALASLGKTVQSLLNKREFNLLVNSVDMPRFQVDMDEKNQYNRKKLVQTRIRFEPVSFSFHDDMAGLTTLLWEAYYRYYSQDPNYAQKNTSGQPDTTVPRSYNTFRNNMYGPEDSNTYRYGLDNNKKKNIPFFNSITVNHLYSNNARPEFTSFTLVNPLISNWQHDNLDQSDNSFTKNTMRIMYENVLYGRGRTGVDEPAGFADPSHYDLSVGVLNTNGVIGDLFTIGGFVNGVSTVFSDIANKEVDLNTILTGLLTLQNLQNLQTTTLSPNINQINATQQQSGIVLPRDTINNAFIQTLPVRTQ